MNNNINNKTHSLSNALSETQLGNPPLILQDSMLLLRIDVGRFLEPVSKRCHVCNVACLDSGVVGMQTFMTIAGGRRTKLSTSLTSSKKSCT